MAPALKTLKKRGDFLRAQRGVRRSAGALTLEICPSPGPSAEIRVGYTASRKVGGAVQRNRAKRRLRAAAKEVLPLLGRTGHDYVLVARTATLTRAYAGLLDDLRAALDAAHAKLGQSKAGGQASQ